MKKVLALDISTSTGYSLQDHSGSEVKLLEHGTIANPKKIAEYGEHPWGYLRAAQAMGTQIITLIARVNPEIVVIEETNAGSRARFVQKILEYIHFSVLSKLDGRDMKVVYINTKDWRKAVGGHLSAQEKKNNAKLSQLKRKCRKNGVLDIKLLNQEKKRLGIAGKVNKKHVAVNLVNLQFGLSLLKGDDDSADAICEGWGLFLGAPVCDGK